MTEQSIYAADGSGQADSIRSRARAGLDRIAERTRGALQTARGRADGACSRAMTGARDQVALLETCVREKPLKSMAVAAAGGLLAGLLLGGGLGAAGHREYLRRR